MKKILVVGMSNNIGGVETYFHNYYQCLDKNKYHFDFVTVCDAIAFSDEYEKDGFKIYRLPNFTKRPFAYYRKMRKIMRDGKYDIVHINMLSAANILPVKAALAEKVPKIIVHSHNTNMPKGSFRKILHTLNKGVLADSRLTRLACAEMAGRWLFDDNDFVVMNNVIDIEKFEFSLNNRKEIRNKYGVNDDDFLIGNIGRICEQKNQIFLVEVLKKIESRNIKLMIVGDGDEKSLLVDKIRAYGLEDRVIIALPTQEIEKYYSAFDVFALPSRFEGMPVVLVEAQANGLKTVISDKIIEYPNAQNTICLKLEELDSWSESIENLASLHNAQRFDSIEEKVLENYDVRLQYHKMEEAYGA